MVASADNVKIFENRKARAIWSARCFLRCAWERLAWWRWASRFSIGPSRRVAEGRLLKKCWTCELIIAGWPDGLAVWSRNWKSLRFKASSPLVVGFEFDPVLIARSYELAPHVVSENLTRKQQAEIIFQLFGLQEDREGLAALQSIVETIPDEVMALLADIPTPQHSRVEYLLLRLIRIAVDTVEQDWVLKRIARAAAFWTAVVESELLVSRGGDSVDADLISRLFRSTHDSILYELFQLNRFPRASRKVCRRVARLFGKLPRNDQTWRDICLLATVYRDASPQHRGWIVHAPRLTSVALALLHCDSARHLVTHDLFLDACDDVEDTHRPGADTADRLRKIVKEEQRLGVPRSGPFTSVRDVHRRFAELDDIAHDRQRACVLPSLELPRFETPAPSGVDQLTSVRELLEEGQVQRNCVGSLVHEACKGEVFVFRVREPQRATLRLTRRGGEWRCCSMLDLKAKGNRDVSDITRQIVEDWVRSLNESSK